MTYDKVSSHSANRFLQFSGRGHGRSFAFGHGGGHTVMGGGGMPGARKLSSADLQLVLLALLEQAPAHGYELIRSIEQRSNGFYTPSPGMIYPALTFIEEIGHAAVELDGNRKRYRLTDLGLQHLEAHRSGAEAMLDALGRIGSRMEQVREAFAGVDEPDRANADEFHQARHALKHALERMRGCTAEEARRIVEIMERATAEIRDMRT